MASTDSATVDALSESLNGLAAVAVAWSLDAALNDAGLAGYICVFIDYPISGPEHVLLARHLERWPALPLVFLLEPADGLPEFLSEAGDTVDAVYKPVHQSLVRSKVCLLLELLKSRRGTASRALGDDLSEADRLSRMLADIDSDATWEWDLGTNRIRWSVRTSTLLGFLPAQIGTDPQWWFDRIHPAEREAVVQGLYDLTRGRGNQWSEQCRVRDAGGNYTQVINRGYIVRDRSGQASLALGSILEITERRLTQTALRQSQERLSAIIHQSTAGLAECDVHGRFTLVNDCFCKMVGRTRSELLGKMTVQEIINPEDLPATTELFRNAVSDSGPFVTEKRYLRPDGSYIWVSSSVSSLRNEHGEVTALVVVTIDITERKRTEEALRRSERYWRALADRAPAMLWLTDREGRGTYLSQQWRDFTGSEGGEWRNDWLEAIHPEDVANVRTIFQKSNLRHESFEVDYRVKHHSGEWRWATTAGGPRFGPGGEFLGFIGTMLDITPRKIAEESLTQRNEELTKANRALEEFAYAASHDLQEPLRTINIYTEMLVRNIPPGSSQSSQHAGFVAESVKRMEELIHGLLSYSRVIHGDAFTMRTASLADALSQAMGVLNSRIEESGASITTGPLPIVRGDSTQLAQIFQNLLANSIKYAKVGRPPVINISAERKGNAWVISVRDNGMGFLPQYAERIFGLFKRLHRDAYPGTGLGLAICRRIVERHGGRMWAEGNLNEGATFYFSLSDGNR